MEETTIWEDFLDHINDLYNGVDGNYENLGLGSNSMISVSAIVLGLFLGIAIACIAMAYNKQVLGGFVRKLIINECNSAQSAKELSELGYLKNPFIRSAVQNSVNLRKVVKCAEEDEFYKQQSAEREAYEKKRADEPSLPKFKDREYRVDASSDHFYVPEQSRDTAERKFYAKGSSWLTTVVAIVMLCIAFFLLLIFLPEILRMADDFMGSFKSNDPYGR